MDTTDSESNMDMDEVHALAGYTHFDTMYVLHTYQIIDNFLILRERQHGGKNQIVVPFLIQEKNVQKGATSSAV